LSELPEKLVTGDPRYVPLASSGQYFIITHQVLGLGI